MPKLKLLSWKWLTLNLWWCILIGLILPRTPNWGLPIVIILAISMIIALSIILFEQTWQVIRGAISKTLKVDSMYLPLPLITSTIVSVSLVKLFSKNLPSNVIEFILLAIFSIWGWLEITSRTGIKLQPSFCTFHSIVIILSVSIVGIAVGQFIHLSLNGQTLGTLFFLFITGFIVTRIPDGSIPNV